MFLHFDSFLGEFIDFFSVFQLPDYVQLLLPEKNKTLLEQFGMDRDYAARVFSDIETIYQIRLGSILNLPSKTVLMLLPYEAKLCLQRNEYPEDLHKRTTCAISIIEGKTTVLWNEEADALFSKVYKKKENPLEKKELRGQSVCAGTIQGFVHLALNEDDFRSIPHGAVLVCPMVRYKSLPLILNKVSAIVTDQGGITCHAAIIAREFGIPTIVGTGEATNFFRMGDRVELDADNGVVRKIF